MRRSRFRRLARPLAVLLPVAAAAVAYRRVFPLGPVVAAGLPSVGLPFMATVALHRRPAPVRLLAGLLTTLLVAVGVAAAAAVPAAGAAAPRAVATALLSGWSRILTTTLLAAPTPDRLAVVPLSVGVAAALAGLALTARQPVRAAAPALLLLTAALLLGVGGPGSVAEVTLPVAAACLLLLLTVAEAPEPRAKGGELTLPPARPGTVLAALLVGVLAVVIGVVVGPRFPARAEPMDLREVVTPPVEVEAVADPLAVLSRRLGPESGEPMFTARLSRAAAGAKLPWRLATFDRYDGIGWSSSLPASSIGTSLVAGANPSERAEVVVSGLDGLWVPTLGEPGAAQPADLRFDEESGALLDPAFLQEGRRYVLGFDLPVRDPDTVASAPAGTGSPQLTQTVCLPKVLKGVAGRVRQAGGTPAGQAQALARALATFPEVRGSSKAAPGSSCGRVAALFTSPDKRGTSEQFATAFALAARELGLPTRLAVGFRPGATSARGTVVVTGADAFAWPEVLLGAGLGWVPFDPTPAVAGDARPQVKPPDLKPVPAPKTAIVPTPASTKSSSLPAQGEAGERRIPVVSLAALLVALVALPPVAVVVAKVRRRRQRLRRPEPRAAVLGAWEELLDRLAETRLVAGPATATRVATLIAGEHPTLAGTGLELAVLVNRAVYDPGPLSAQDAGRAWSASDGLVRGLRSDQGVLTRLRNYLSVRPLRRGVSPTLRGARRR